MSELEWVEDYNVGIPAIDNEHKLLVSLINDMGSVVETNPEVQLQIIGDTLNTLDHCIRTHFESEERFLLANNYPEIDTQKAEHTLLIEQLEQFEKTFRTEMPSFTEHMLLYFKDWLIRHIILHDCKFGNYFRDKTIINYYSGRPQTPCDNSADCANPDS